MLWRVKLKEKLTKPCDAAADSAVRVGGAGGAGGAKKWVETPSQKDGRAISGSTPPVAAVDGRCACWRFRFHVTHRGVRIAAGGA